ncbi:hypothetical protein XELAEV_18041099mg [Xenopus laevis]|uniref:Trafficking protein particle complex subunit 6B n=2 Tax=Xenopus laevis TaxID=8355 RepID=A0A974H577_XENLA|nr:hypothetical protein XELAEV_18041099mg [Xenopus laevis]
MLLTNYREALHQGRLRQSFALEPIAIYYFFYPHPIIFVQSEAEAAVAMNKQDMADEALFLLLHNEIISCVYKAEGDADNGKCITKLENMGFRVGQGLTERSTKDTARFKDELDIMKFVCKDFWTTVFKKQIDNLRTNHQGIYVLQDNKFRLITQMSAGKQYLEHAPKYLAFSCGLIRGGLSNLGIKSIVTAEVSVMPACKFQVMIQKL